jgi:hypothetical protein
MGVELAPSPEQNCPRWDTARSQTPNCLSRTLEREEKDRGRERERERVMKERNIDKRKEEGNSRTKV